MLAWNRRLNIIIIIVAINVYTICHLLYTRIQLLVRYEYNQAMQAKHFILILIFSLLIFSAQYYDIFHFVTCYISDSRKSRSKNIQFFLSTNTVRSIAHRCAFPQELQLRSLQRTMNIAGMLAPYLSLTYSDIYTYQQRIGQDAQASTIWKHIPNLLVIFP